MKNLFLFTLNLLFLVALSQPAAAQNRQADSLALVAFYNSACNSNCLIGWNLNQSMDNWPRVTMLNGRVSELVCVSDGLDGNLPDLNLSALRVLRLDGNSFTGFIPNFSGMPNLEVLRLDRNGLFGTIPNFSGMPNLKELNVRVNQLSGVLPDFSNFPNLENLTLSSNQFSGALPDFSGMPKLLELWSGYNNISGSIPDFSGMPLLQELFMTENNISGSIPDFSGMPNLRILELGSNQLTGSITNFSNFPILNQLGLPNNQLSGTIPAFSSLNTLKFFDVTNNRLEGLIPDLANLLSNDLQQVELEGNKFTFEDFLPHFLNLCNQLGFSRFDYQDQDSIGAVVVTTLGSGGSYTIDLVVDDAVASNVYYWSKDGVVIDTIYGINEYTVSNFTGADAGIYTAEIINTTINNYNCRDLSLYSRPVTIKALNSTVNIQTIPLQVSPNPVQNILYIQTQAMTADYQIAVINLQGQVVERLSGNSNSSFTLPMTQYPAGIYLVRLQQGDKIWQEKVTKQ